MSIDERVHMFEDGARRGACTLFEAIAVLTRVVVILGRHWIVCVHGCNFFTILLLKSAIHHFLTSEGERQYLAFETPIRTFKWNIMPLGISGAPAHGQDVVTITLRDMLGSLMGGAKFRVS